MAAAGTAGPAAGEEFAIVRDGQAQVDIVYAAPDASASAKSRARFQECLDDFRAIVTRISGAELGAVSADEAAGRAAANTIQVGLTPAAREAGIAERAAGLKPHALLIHADPRSKVLYLAGSTPEGTGHALYEFLETLGCRWYMPGAFGEKLPVTRTIGVGELDLVREPEFELRAIQLRAKGAAAPGTTVRAEVMEWMRRNKFGGSGPSRGHHFHKLVPEAEYGEEHPEYYSLRDGGRRTSHLCMSNPGTLEAAEKYLTEYFTRNPEADGHSVALADGAQYCECPDCTAACGGDARNIMPLYLAFVGELFDRIDRKFPDREFQYGFYVYSNLMEPPEGEVPKQLAPYIAPLGYDAFHTSAEPQRYLSLSVAKDFPRSTLERIEADPRSEPGRKVTRVIEGWSRGTSNLYLRDYDPYITFAQNMPLVRTYQLAIEIPWHKEIGVRGYTPEATANSWFTSGINFWVRSRYYWDTGADIGQVMQDYCKGLFGAAWEPMYGFLDALARRTIESTAFRHGDHVLTRLYHTEWVKQLDFWLSRAEQLAATDRERERVNMWRLCQQHMLRYLGVREAELKGDFANAAALGDDYLRFLDYISTVNPHFVDPRWYAEREFSMQTLVPQYRRNAALLNGGQGRSIAPLPTRWYFKHDPNDAGLTEAWYAFEPAAEYEPGSEPAEQVDYPPMPGWRLQSTEESWQTREEDYQGYNWYRTQIALPAALEGNAVRMLVTGIFGHMDFFINGRRVEWTAQVKGANGEDNRRQVNHLDLGSAWSWNYNESFSVGVEQYLRFGAINTVAFRTRDARHWGGIFKRVQLFTTQSDFPLPTTPAEPCDCSR